MSAGCLASQSRRRGRPSRHVRKTFGFEALYLTDFGGSNNDNLDVRKQVFLERG
jgi:hypothetical protein